MSVFTINNACFGLHYMFFCTKVMAYSHIFGKKIGCLKLGRRGERKRTHVHSFNCEACSLDSYCTTVAV